jgi:DNA-binding transcriptional MerR regulator
MRMSELSGATGIPVATVKYYLREGLLPAGTPISATSAVYDGTHVERLRLIRALIEGAALSIAQVRRVTQTLDNPPDTWHGMLGTAQSVLCGPADEGVETAPADALLRRLGWAVGECSPARADLARALARLDAGGISVSPQDLDGYAASAQAAAVIDVAALPTDTPEAALRRAVVGTVLLDNVLIALRRLAQEDVSARTFAGRRTSGAATGAAIAETSRSTG